MQKINILGTLYTFEFKNYDECEEFKKYSWAGYCEEYKKNIVIGRIKTFPDMKNESDENCEEIEKRNLRHEIIHAFFNESGLSDNSFEFTGAWAKNEEMVDWFSIQSPKIFKVFKDLNIL